MEYYSFIIDGKKIGYFETEYKDGVLYQNAFIEMDGNVFQYPFWVKQVDGTITSFKFGDGDWNKITKYQENAYPTSAFEILAKSLVDGASIEYNIINEGEDLVTGKAKLTRNGNKVSEFINDQEGRYILFNDRDEVFEYGWGGPAKSIRVENKTEAIMDTAFTE